MSNRQESRRIFWMVHLLAAVGLTTIIVLIGLVGRQVRTIHIERGKLEEEQRFLYRASEEILHRAGKAHEEIAALFDENEDVLLGKSGAADKLAEMIDPLVASAKTSFSLPSISPASPAGISMTRLFTGMRNCSTKRSSRLSVMARIATMPLALQRSTYSQRSFFLTLRKWPSNKTSGARFWGEAGRGVFIIILA